MSDCIFCKIANKEIPSEFLYEDDNVVAFRDLNPQAPAHVLIVPKTHIENFVADEVAPEVLQSMNKAAKTITEDLNLKDLGVRLIMNCGKDAGQTVMHLHMHLLGGKTLSEALV